MPSKKKKYNARFPAGRIKKIMQSDEEIGKVAQAVPVIISRTLELFVDSLLTKTLKITNSRNAKTLSTSHMKQCIMSEQRFDFLRELVKNIPDISVAEEAANYNEDEAQSSPEEQYPDSDTPYDLSMPSTSTQATRSATSAAARTNGGNYNYRTTRANGASSNVSTLNQQRAYLIASAQLDDERRAHVKREAEILLRLEQPIGGGVPARAAAPPVAAISGSVIKHTTSLNAEGALPKLGRSDSTPANMTAAANHWPTQTQTQSHRQQRLKHQSQSVPYSNSVRSISHHQPQAHPCSAPKQQKLENMRPAQAVIPQAPIVSFDFCNKPVVKIEYSNLNLPIPANKSAAAPLSAPANIAAAHHHPTSSQFNFNTEPVINIDLSNINVGSVTTSATTPNGPPAVATISIGAIPAAVPAPTPAPLTNPKATTMAIASFVNPNNNNNNTTNSSVAASAACKNSFFELDEDYDNI